MAEKHALLRAFLYAASAWDSIARGNPREAVSLRSIFPVCSGTRAGCLSRSGSVEYVFCVQWEGAGYLSRSGSMEHFPVCGGTGVKPVFVLEYILFMEIGVVCQSEQEGDRICKKNTINT